jgi:hypothetical protein
LVAWAGVEEEPVIAEVCLLSTVTTRTCLHELDRRFGRLRVQWPRFRLCLSAESFPRTGRRWDLGPCRGEVRDPLGTVCAVCTSSPRQSLDCEMIQRCDSQHGCRDPELANTFYRLLGCGAAWVLLKPTFRRKVLSPSSG